MVIKKPNKKTLSFFVLLILLVSVSVVNYKFQPQKSKDTSVSTTAAEEDNAPYNAELVSAETENEIMTGNKKVDNSFFVEYRTLRDQKRSENIEVLEGIVNNGDKDSEGVKNAQNEMVYLVKLSENELNIENQIKAKGFSDCIVFLHDDYANVVVDTSEISPQQAAQIQDIVNKNTAVEIADISIATSVNAQN